MMRMYPIVFALVASITVSSTWGQAPTGPPVVDATPLAVDAKISAVTLYRGRASVTRSATIPLQPGVYDLQITGLPESIQPQTLQARTTGALKVLNVDFSQEQTADPLKQFAELDATIEDLTRQLKEIGEQRNLIKVQEQFIDALSAKVAAEASKDTGTVEFDADAMRKQLAFIAEERGKLLTATRELDAKQRTLEKQLQAAQDKRNSMAGSGNVSRTAVISAAATEAGEATVHLTYLVSEATWQPTYNIRASITGGTTQLEYDAMLTQRTGEDWNDVKLTLSTAQPTLAANPPTLDPWYVDVYQPQVLQEKFYSYSKEVPATAAIEDRAAGAPADKGKNLGFLDADASIVGEGPSVSFELPRAVTVKTNAQKQQRTRIASSDSKAEFIHVATPMLTEAVYIRGDLLNTSAYQILPGTASIFVGQDYVGPTTLPSIAPNGEFELHFGIDPSVKVTRQMVTKKTENTGLLSGGRRTSFDYRLLIDNGSGKAITLELWDRYPISRSADIQIETVDLSHALTTDPEYVAEKLPQGFLKWVLTVPAKATGKSAGVVSYGVRINRAKGVEMTPLPE